MSDLNQMTAIVGVELLAFSCLVITNWPFSGEAPHVLEEGSIEPGLRIGRRTQPPFGLLHSSPSPDGPLGFSCCPVCGVGAGKPRAVGLRGLPSPA